MTKILTPKCIFVIRHCLEFVLRLFLPSALRLHHVTLAFRATFAVAVEDSVQVTDMRVSRASCSMVRGCLPRQLSTNMRAIFFCSQRKTTCAMLKVWTGSRIRE